MHQTLLELPQKCWLNANSAVFIFLMSQFATSHFIMKPITDHLKAIIRKKNPSATTGRSGFVGSMFRPLRHSALTTTLQTSGCLCPEVLALSNTVEATSQLKLRYCYRIHLLHKLSSPLPMQLILHGKHSKLLFCVRYVSAGSKTFCYFATVAARTSQNLKNK